MLPQLNFPFFKFRFKKNKNGDLLIFDEIRKKFVALTPEEWVRQHLITYLYSKKKYPKSLFSVEQSLKLNATDKRSDIRIYNNNKELLLIAECKAPSVKLDIKALEQVMRYELALSANWLILSNGLSHLIFEKNTENKFQPAQDFPEFKNENYK